VLAPVSGIQAVPGYLAGLFENYFIIVKKSLLEEPLVAVQDGILATILDFVCTRATCTLMRYVSCVSRVSISVATNDDRWLLSLGCISKTDSRSLLLGTVQNAGLGVVVSFFSQRTTFCCT
jgi:hypothetical protein